jgi:glutamine amidotransferase PdxT
METSFSRRDPRVQNLGLMHVRLARSFFGRSPKASTTDCGLFSRRPKKSVMVQFRCSETTIRLSSP